MELPNSHHHQGMASHHQSLEEVLQGCPKSNSQQQEIRKARPQPEQALKCPRCASTNTKFCYYNNYSLSQPRYFCKGCRRYWTQGGSLRNVPVGGGCRRNKRSSNSSSSSSSANPSSAKVKALLEPNNPMATSSNPLLLPTLLPPPIGYDPSDLTLAFHATLHKQQPPPQASTKHLGLEHDSTLNSNLFLGHPGAEHIPSAHTSGFLDILRTGFVDTRSCTSGLNNFYYGFAGGNGSGLELGSLVGDQDQAVLSSEGGGGGGLVGAPASTMTRQGSSCKDMDEADATKVLMGFPWQVAAGDNHGSGMSAVDSAGRDYWAAAGIAASSWHGLINNPLM